MQAAGAEGQGAEEVGGPLPWKSLRQGGSKRRGGSVQATVRGAEAPHAASSRALGFISVSELGAWESSFIVLLHRC